LTPIIRFRTQLALPAIFGEHPKDAVSTRRGSEVGGSEMAHALAPLAVNFSK